MPTDGWLHDEIERLGAAHPLARLAAPGPRVFGEVQRLRRILDSVAPEVVHLHSSKAGLAGRLGSPAASPRSSSRTPGRSRRRAVLSAGAGHRAPRCALVTLIVCVSEARAAARRRHGISADWRVVLNGVDLERSRRPSPESGAEPESASSYRP